MEYTQLNPDNEPERGKAISIIDDCENEYVGTLEYDDIRRVPYFCSDDQLLTLAYDAVIEWKYI